MGNFNAAGLPFLEITDLCHSYSGKAALRNVSLSANKSEVLALLGPSGSGKSTLLAAIAGMIIPSNGRILLDGRNLLELAPEARGLGMVFQDFALWPHMSVAQNVSFPLRVRNLAPTEIAKRTKNTLTRVGLAGFAARRPHELSGGQQQRVALARAVIAETELLLLDEPLSALDPATRAAVRSELSEILRYLNLTTIIVTHDREEAFELADRVAILFEGEIQQHSTPEEVYERPANITVARFMGANVLSVRLQGDGKAVLDNSGTQSLQLPRPVDTGSGYIAVIPEQVQLTTEASNTNNVLRGRLLQCQYRGGEYRLRIKIGGPEAGQIIEARSKHAPRQQELSIRLPPEALHVIENPPRPGTKNLAHQRMGSAKLTKLQETIA